MAFANDTLVLTPEGDRQITKIKVNDLVQVRMDDESWESTSVDFSAGTLTKTIVYTISYGGGQQIIVTPDQLLLVSEELLKPAKDLVLTDSLMDKSSNAITITDISIEEYLGGVHSIATSEHPTANTDGHLLLCNGIIVGGYALEMGYRMD